MALTKEEIEEIKVLLKFPLKFNDAKYSIVKSRGADSIICFQFSNRAVNKTSENFRGKILNCINGLDYNDSNFKVKNIVVRMNSQNQIMLSGIELGYLPNVRTFESALGADFIRAGRINRIYTEYILERMKYLFNDKS